MKDDPTFKIIGAAIETHRALGGPGLLEKIYEAALCHELSLQGLKVQRQLPLPVIYKGVEIKDPLVIDLIVENKVIVEIKATEKETSVHELQLLTYLRLTGMKVGLLINFGLPTVKDGIKRIVNGV